MILLNIASVIVSRDELNTLGIYLSCNPDDVRRLKNTNTNLKDAAYEILYSFYNSVPNKERWGILIGALKQLNKNTVVMELKIEELHEKAQHSG